MDINVRKWRNRASYFCTKVTRRIRTNKKCAIISIFAIFLLTIWFLRMRGKGLIQKQRKFKFHKLSKLDLNKDGRVDLKEFLKFGQIPDVKVMSPSDLLKVTDLDEDKKVSFEEFLGGGLKKGFGSRAEKLYFERVAGAYFEQADTDSDGFLSVYDWRKLIKDMQDAMRFVNDADVEQIFKIIDLNKDGYLTQFDFEEANIMSAMDSDSDGKVSLMEYLGTQLRAVRSKDKSIMVTFSDRKFLRVDTNHNGFLTQDEFEVLRSLERRLVHFITSPPKKVVS